MKVGFIGAGRVGVTLGRYFLTSKKFREKHSVLGYYDSSKDAIKEAIRITNTDEFSLKDLVNNSEVLFLTVTDVAIKKVWEDISSYDLKNKIICHCSGALSSKVFSCIEAKEAYGYSVHPLFACSSKEDSYKDISNALFTIEGNKEKIEFMKNFIEGLGNNVQLIEAKDKVKYHASAVMASNQVLGLLKTACDLLMESGFSEDNALMAIKPLVYGNIDNIYRQGLKDALTGPVARGDMETVRKHMDVLKDDTKQIYELLTTKLIEIKKLNGGLI